MPTIGLNSTLEYGVQSTSSRNTYGTNWAGGSSNIWGAPIGTGMRDAPRANSRPPPLTQPLAGHDLSRQSDDNSSPEQVTGSSSLLRASEGEGWSSRWPPVGASAGLNNGRGRALNPQSGTSPVRNRTNQHTRESSPFFVPQPSAIGTGPINRQPSASLLDPTTTSFAPRNNLSPFSSTFSPKSEADEANRRQVNGLSFGNVSTDPTSYTGYASSAASRNGSLPPSRHGMEPPSQFGDFGLANPASAEAFMHRPNQHSRNSNFSLNSYANGRASSHAWQSSMGDLSATMARMEVGRNGQDRPGSSYWDPSHHISSPGSINGLSNMNYQRSGSLSLEPGTNLLNPAMNGYGQTRFANGVESYSPTGSDSRQSTESPMAPPNPNQPIQDWQRGLPSHNSRTNLNNYSGYGPIDGVQLDQALNRVAHAQSYQPSPALSQRSLYSAGYNITGSSTPNNRMTPQISPYYQQQVHTLPYGQAMQSARHPPRGPASDTQERRGSALLQEFHITKGSKKYELKDVYGHIVEFSGDQHGSRFLQQKLETANSDEKAQIFSEILPNAVPLMTDLFGNYVIQKFFEHGNQQQKKQLADKMKGNVSFLSMQMYACRVVQKALDVILVDQQASLIKELDGKVIKCVKDQNGNHVIQKAIERIPSEHINFITSAFTGQVHHLAVHNYGCRVIQRMLESSHEPAKTEILDELHGCVSNLVVDQYGNYVTQNIVKHGRPSDRDKVIAIVTSNFVSFATQKFASNVVETAFVYGSYEQRQKMIGVTTSIDTNGDSTMIRLMRDQFGNYIIQRFIKHLQDVASVEEYDNFVEMLRPQLDKLKNISYGKQIGTIEKLIASPRPTNPSQSSPSSNGAHQPIDVSSSPTPPLIEEDAQSPRSSSHPSTSHSTAGDCDSGAATEVPEKPVAKVEVNGGDDQSNATPNHA